MSVEPAARSLVVSEAATVLRRELGPTAWFVLEEMLLRSDRCAVVPTTRVSVRALAVSLGLNKDTVGNALGRLRDRGLVVASQSRSQTGVFEPGVYAIVVPAGIAVTAPMPALARPRSRTVRRDADQLSLAIES